MSKFREYLEGKNSDKLSDGSSKSIIAANWLQDYVTKEIYKQLTELNGSGFSVIDFKVGNTKVIISLNNKNIDSFSFFNSMEHIKTSKQLEDYIKIGNIIQGLSEIIPFRKK